MTDQELADAGPEDEDYITPADVLDRLDVRTQRLAPDPDTHANDRASADSG